MAGNQSTWWFGQLKLTIRFTFAARKDLEGIYDYTCTTWGKVQANRYTDVLQATVEAIEGSRGLWRSMPEWCVGGYRITCRQHMIFFVATGSEITIARVLHERQDVVRHLIEANR